MSKTKQTDKMADVTHLKHLVPDPQNARKHNPRNIGTIVDSLHEVGAARSIVIDENNVVLAGNGVVEAAGEAGIESVRVVEANGNEIIAVRRRGLTDSQKKRLALFDNRAAELAEWNPEELVRLEKECPEALEGMFRDGELEEALREGVDILGMTEADNTYTGKIVVPVYEPKGEKPPVSALIDRTKTTQLMAGIEAAGLPDEVAEFLRFAAERHTVFNFRQIAEFYCHADATVKDLFEKSGLVIIDFDKAIENGFVHLTEKLGELADSEEADA